MQALKDEFKVMQTRIMEEFKSVLDKRGIGGTGFFNTKTLLEKMDLMQTKLIEKLDRCMVNAGSNIFVSCNNPTFDPN